MPKYTFRKKLNITLSKQNTLWLISCPKNSHYLETYAYIFKSKWATSWLNGKWM